MSTDCLPLDTINVVTDALRTAQGNYHKAHDEANAARSREPQALNELNVAQKNFDHAVSNAKKNPPWNSTWHQTEKHSHSA